MNHFPTNQSKHQGSKLGWTGGPSLPKIPSDHQTEWGSGPVGYQNITFASFFITFAVAVTATMFFVFNISNIVIYSFFVASGNSISNISSNVYAE